MPIIKRPCANCPFRLDGAGIQISKDRMAEIFTGLLEDDHRTFVCHKTLNSNRMTCAGAMGVMLKLGRLPLIARLAIAMGVISQDDVSASADMVIDPSAVAVEALPVVHHYEFRNDQ